MSIKEITPQIDITSFADMRARSVSRRALKGLSTDQLNDIGLTRELAFMETKKPFWVK